MSEEQLEAVADTAKPNDGQQDLQEEDLEGVAGGSKISRDRAIASLKREDALFD